MYFALFIYHYFIWDVADFYLELNAEPTTPFVECTPSIEGANIAKSTEIIVESQGVPSGYTVIKRENIRDKFLKNETAHKICVAIDVILIVTYYIILFTHGPHSSDP